MGPDPPAAPSPAAGRVCIVLAALLWSTSGGFSKVLTKDTAFALNDPPLAPLLIAFYRALFAGLALAPTVRRADLTFRPLMLVMVVTFAAMNALFVSAQTLGTAATAILLQYTAPMWMYAVGVWLLGEAADRRGGMALALGMVGVAVIVAGGWRGGDLVVIVIALASGVTCAGVLLCLRALRDCSSGWLTVWNHLGGALALVPFVVGLPWPTLPQLVTLVLFGGVQLGLAYYLMARGLRSVSAQEAGAITLLEPIINPVWAYLVAGEAVDEWTFVGGGFILGALAYRYWPGRAAVIASSNRGEPPAR
jgi:drug/metabolite transporter (DMT)-like permease